MCSCLHVHSQIYVHVETLSDVPPPRPGDDKQHSENENGEETYRPGVADAHWTSITKVPVGEGLPGEGYNTTTVKKKKKSSDGSTSDTDGNQKSKGKPKPSGVETKHVAVETPTSIAGTPTTSTAPTKRKYSPLPLVTWPADIEFDTYREPHTVQILDRLFRESMKSILDPASMFLLGSAGMAVVLLAGYEAALTLNPAFLFSGDVAALKYIATYAYENTVSSVVWGTKPGYLIARSLELEPAEVLRVFSPKMMSAVDAEMQLKIQGAQFGRSIAGGFMVMAQLLRIVTVTVRASDQYHERVLNGREPLIHGIQARIVRLCGKKSNTTSVSIRRMGEHIMPVFESTTAVERFVRSRKFRYRVPMYWRIDNGQYGTTEAWSGFLLEQCGLLRTSTGKSILYMEADCTPTQQLLFIQDGNDSDLTIEDACQGFRMLESRAKFKNLQHFRVIRVLLGDLSRLQMSGGGHRFTLRDRLESRAESDIMIDARAFLIHKVLKWCRRVAKPDTDHTIVVETTNPQCFKTLKSLLGEYKYRVVDAFDPNLQANLPDVEKPIHLPRLVYYDATMQTVNATLALVEAKGVDPSKLCAVFDEYEGIDALMRLRSKTNFRFEPICTSVLYDDCFRMVRAYVKLGHSAEEIQEELDIRFNNNMLAEAQLGKGWCSLAEHQRAHAAYEPERVKP
eukprot:CFRG3743T1